jgi:hypothetical protein
MARRRGKSNGQWARGKKGKKGKGKKGEIEN